MSVAQLATIGVWPSSRPRGPDLPALAVKESPKVTTCLAPVPVAGLMFGMPGMAGMAGMAGSGGREGWAAAPAAPRPRPRTVTAAMAAERTLVEKDFFMSGNRAVS